MKKKLIFVHKHGKDMPTTVILLNYVSKVRMSLCFFMDWRKLNYYYLLF